MRGNRFTRASLGLALLLPAGGLSCGSNDTFMGGPLPCPASCPAAEPFCNPSAGSCVECRSAADCSSAQACSADGDCVDRCTTDAQCGGGQALCDTAHAVCVECFTSAECADTSHPLCGPGGRCSDCASNADCDPGQTCDFREGRCE